MAMKIRLARGGSKKRPFYRVVAADARMPRDGRFIEKLGTYNPLLPKDSEERVKLDLERIQHWISQGAQPTDRVSRMLEAAGVIPAKTRNNPIKAKPGKKAIERAEEKAAKAAAPVEEEAPAEEADIIANALRNGSVEEIDKVVSIVKQYDGLTGTMEKAKRHIDSAILQLDGFPENTFSQAMKDLALFSINRSY